MVRKLVWTTILALLSLPVILYLGRPVVQPCAPRYGAVRGPCDPPTLSPTWMVPVFLTALAVAVLLLGLLIIVLLFRARGHYQRQQDNPVS
jgi:hypothetical protein